jgi:hypothetical protein
MKVLFLFVSLTILKLNAQTTKGYSIDYKDPTSLVNAVFYAAQTKDFQILPLLCDPLGENDGDTKSLCGLYEIISNTSENYGTEITPIIESEFILLFKNGKLNGQITYEELDGVKYANVPFIFNNSDGSSRSNESMRLVNRYGNWYFFSF